MHKNIDFLGIKIASVSKKDMVSLLLNFGQDSKKRTAFYLNAHCVNLACSDHYYQTILNKSDLVYAGGKGVVWASRFLGNGLPERVNILDFFDAFSKEACLRKTSFYLLGGTNEVVSKTANILRNNGLNVLGCRHGFFTAEEERDIICEINTLQPNILIVGMGVPKQEKWICEHYPALRVNLLWGVGAAFEWLSGKRKRAPGWMIECGLEWLHRFCQQPRRLWRRYLIGNLLFLWRVLTWNLVQIKNKVARILFCSLKKHLSYPVKNKFKYLRHCILNVFSTVVIETMTTCNRSCSFCPNHLSGRGLAANEKKMEMDLFHKIIHELVELRWMGGISLNFFNEPLMDERLTDWIAYVRDKLPSCPINIFTNGDFLDVELYKKLAASGITTLFITQYQKEEMINIADVKKYREMHGDDHVELIHSNELLISNRGGLIDLPRGVATFKRCYVRTGRVHINYNGDVLLCCQDYFNSVKLGNLNNERIIDVWNKPYFRQLRKEITRDVYSLDLCKKCQTTKIPMGIAAYEAAVGFSEIK